MDILLDITAGADVKLFTLKGSSAAQVITNNTTTTWTLKVARPAQSDSVGAISIS